MYFRVAELLHRTVDELLDSITSEELTGWVAYLNLKAKAQEKATTSR